jgi:tetratricopeptide (TPR) repeat protein
MDRTRIFEAAGKLAAKGQLDKAAREYQRILDEDPKDVRALQKLSEIWQKTGRARESADLLLRVAESYSEQGFFLKAVAVYKQILKLVPDRIEVNQRLAQLYQQLGLVGDATQQYQVVVNYFDKVGNAKESLAALRKMVELDPDNIASQVKLGELYAREGLILDAVNELRKASQYLKRNNRLDDFLRVLERMGQLAPEDPAVAKEVATGFLGQGDPRRALARLQICFRADPKDVDTLELLAKAFSALNQDGKAVSVYRELANVHAERKNTDAERDTLGRILDISPGDAEAVTRLREIAQRHAPPAVIAIAPMAGTMPAPEPARPAPAPAPARRLSPGLSPSLARILTETDVYLKYGLIPKAAEHVRRAIAEDPNCIDAREKLVAVLDRQGKPEEAVRELARIVELARANADRERDSLYTQELAARVPEHPLVQAATASAQLPEAADDEEIVVEPDSIDLRPQRHGPQDFPIEDEPVRDPRAVISAAAAGVAEALWGKEEEKPEELEEEENSAEEEVVVDAEELQEGRQSLEASDAGVESALSAAIARVTAPQPGEQEPIDPFAVEAEMVPAAPVSTPRRAERRTPNWAASPSRTATPERREITNRNLVGQVREASLAPAGANGRESILAPPREAFGERTGTPVGGPFAQQYSEAEFLVQQGMYDDARHVLESILQRAPGYAPAEALLDRIRPETTGRSAPVSIPSVAAGLSEGFDLGRELAAELDELEIPMAPKVTETTGGAPTGEDFQTHFDLGNAYREMGKLEEAVHEFEAALQSSGRRRVVDCLLMMGLCRLERSDPGAALTHYEKALQTPGLTLDASKEAHFQIARCHELLSEDRKALNHYARVFKADPDFRDVKARIVRLQQLLKTGGPLNPLNGPASIPGAPPPPAAAVPEGRRSGRGKISYM